MKTKTTNELATLRRKVAELEQYSSKLLLEKQALETVITLGEDHFKIPIRKKSGRGGGPPQTVTYLSIQNGIALKSNDCAGTIEYP